MKRITPTFMLGTIAVIFSYDAVAEWVGGSHATISYWFYEWLHSGIYAPIIFFAVVIGFYLHFWNMKSKT